MKYTIYKLVMLLSTVLWITFVVNFLNYYYNTPVAVYMWIGFEVIMIVTVFVLFRSNGSPINYPYVSVPLYLVGIRYRDNHIMRMLLLIAFSILFIISIVGTMVILVITDHLRIYDVKIISHPELKSKKYYAVDTETGEAYTIVRYVGHDHYGEMRYRYILNNGSRYEFKTILLQDIIDELWVIVKIDDTELKIGSYYPEQATIQKAYRITETQKIIDVIKGETYDT